jgi:membrane protein
MFRTFQIPLTWSELIKRTVKETSADDCLGLAAQLAFYFLLALAPAIVFVLALTSLFPSDLVQQIVAVIGRVAPGDVATIIQQQLQQISAGQDHGLLTFGIGMALWSSSSAMVAITDALNRAYDIEEGRPWWKVRLTALLLTLALAVFAIVAFALVLAGPLLGQLLGIAGPFESVWRILQWPLALVLVVLAVAFINYFAPDAEQDWEWVTPGAVVATVLWLIASLGFKIYVTQFADYNATYGSLGGVIVLMLWFYISSLAILVGAEMNAEIEHASPHGKDVGEKVPGEKKKLGAAAARAFEKRQHDPKPQPRPVTPPVVRDPMPQPTAAASRWPGLATFIVAWLIRRRTKVQ